MSLMKFFSPPRHLPHSHIQRQSHIFSYIYIYTYTYINIFIYIYIYIYITHGQLKHSPQRHTAAGTATPATADTGNRVPQRVNPTQTAYAHPRRRAQAPSPRPYEKSGLVMFTFTREKRPCEESGLVMFTFTREKGLTHMKNQDWLCSHSHEKKG